MNRFISICPIAAVLWLAGCCQPAGRLGDDSLPGKPARTVDPLLDAMTGKWIATGTILDTQRVDDIEAKWILGGLYLQMHEVSENKDASGNRVYEANVLMEVDPKAHDYNCLWLDSTGGGGLGPNKSGFGKRDGDSIALIFKSSDGDTFHTTFVYNRSENTWKWILDGETSGKLEPFARMTLTKIPPPHGILK